MTPELYDDTDGLDWTGIYLITLVTQEEGTKQLEMMKEGATWTTSDPGLG